MMGLRQRMKVMNVYILSGLCGENKLDPLQKLYQLYNTALLASEMLLSV